MMRAISFKLKNGKTVKIRQVRGTDYDAVMRFMDKFARGAGAKWTWEYPGGKRPPVSVYDSPNHFFVAAWDGDDIVGMSSIHADRPDHPWTGRSASTGTSILEKYTSNGLGYKFKQIIEKVARENNIHKLEASVRHKNVRSLGNLLKNGYEVVGVLHDVAFIDGEWHHKYVLEKILEK